MSRRKGILVISIHEFDDFWETDPKEVAEKLVAELKLPSEIKVLNHHKDFDTGELKVRIEWDKLPEVEDGGLLPYLIFVYKDGVPCRVQLYDRHIRTKFRGEIDFDVNQGVEDSTKG